MLQSPEFGENSRLGGRFHQQSDHCAKKVSDIFNVGCLIVITPPIFFLGGGQPSYNNFWESIAGIMICI